MPYTIRLKVVGAVAPVLDVAVEPTERYTPWPTCHGLHEQVAAALRERAGLDPSLRYKLVFAGKLLPDDGTALPGALLTAGDQSHPKRAGQPPPTVLCLVADASGDGRASVDVTPEANHRAAGTVGRPWRLWDVLGRCGRWLRFVLFGSWMRTGRDFFRSMFYDDE